LSVFAGSPLWLDCSSLIQPLESLIQVSWYHREELLYYQFWLNGRNVGYPPNSTNGFMFAARVTSQVVGQITVLPAIPNDDGVYRCSVILEDSTSEGRHSTRTKTFYVFVCKCYNISVLINSGFNKVFQSILIYLANALRLSSSLYRTHQAQ
jgi:hypothetical protein